MCTNDCFFCFLMYSTGGWCCCQCYIVNTSINGCAVKQYEGLLSWSHHVVFQSERLSTFEVMAIHLFVAKTLYWDIWCVLLLLPLTPQLPVSFTFFPLHFSFLSIIASDLSQSMCLLFRSLSSSLSVCVFFSSLKFSLCTSFRSVSVCYVIFHSASLTVSHSPVIVRQTLYIEFSLWPVVGIAFTLNVSY